jgi:hypothetical protein
MAPVSRPFPRFIAESPHELEPHGRWRTMLDELFRSACKSIESDEDLGELGEIVWFPDRTYGIRTFVPARAPTEAGPEVFGYVSFTRSDESPQPTDFIARADYTIETAAENPTWRLDLNDEVIARWRGPEGATGDLTLVWGTPLVQGAVAVTAEIEDTTLDQCALDQHQRFTLVALDAVTEFGDDLYLEIKLWNKRGDQMASETLYEEREDEEEAEGETEGEEQKDDEQSKPA